MSTRAVREAIQKPIHKNTQLVTCPECKAVLSKRKHTDKQLALIAAKAEGMNTNRASIVAGYHHPQSAYEAMLKPHIVQAVEKRKQSRLDKTKALVNKSLKAVEKELDSPHLDPRYALAAVKELSSYQDRLGETNSEANMHEVTDADVARARYKRILNAIRYIELGLNQPSKAGTLASNMRTSIGRPKVLQVSPTMVNSHE